MLAVLISGANKGLGLAIARLMGRQGFRVWLGSRSLEAGTTAADELRAEGSDVSVVQLDVTDAQSVAAAAKRRLRLELAGRSSGADVAAEIRKRLTAIGKSRSFVDWSKVRSLAADLDMQRSAILEYVAPTRPAEAFDLLWRPLDSVDALVVAINSQTFAILAQLLEERLQGAQAGQRIRALVEG